MCKPGEAAAEHVQDVADHSTGGRRHHADALRQARQRALALGVEEPFLGEFLLELFERQLQRAGALRLDGFDDQLIFAARFVDVDAAARQHRHAVLRFKAEHARRVAEGHGTQLRGLILQQEVVMSAPGQLHAGDFACHPNVAEGLAQDLAHDAVQLGDGQDTALGCPI